MNKPTPKSLLRGRTQAQFDFDWGVKGWAFTHPSKMASIANRASALYAAIGFEDPERRETLRAIHATITTDFGDF